MRFDAYKIIDLTHLLSPAIPTWNGSCGFSLEIKKDYDRMFRVQQMKMHAGVGTHMDAPSHRFEGGASIADLSVQEFVAPLCIINVSQKAHADYEISLQDVQQYGAIPPKALVIGWTGWSRFWENPDAYRNIDAKGQMHFPAFSVEAARYLIGQNVVGIGIDTLSPDCLHLDYPVHHTVLGAGKYIIENVADCAKIPSRGCYAIALPLRAEDATECPIRLIALVPN